MTQFPYKKVFQKELLSVFRSGNQNLVCRLSQSWQKSGRGVQHHVLTRIALIGSLDDIDIERLLTPGSSFVILSRKRD